MRIGIIPQSALARLFRRARALFVWLHFQGSSFWVHLKAGIFKTKQYLNSHGSNRCSRLSVESLKTQRVLFSCTKKIDITRSTGQSDLPQETTDFVRSFGLKFVALINLRFLNRLSQNNYFCILGWSATWNWVRSQKEERLILGHLHALWGENAKAKNQEAKTDFELQNGIPNILSHYTKAIAQSIISRSMRISAGIFPGVGLYDSFFTQLFLSAKKRAKCVLLCCHALWF